MARPLKRTFGFAALGAPLLLVVVLSSCGDDDDAASGTTVVIQPSSYIMATTTVAGATTTPGGAVTGEPGDTSLTEQVYTVKPNDYLSGIASDYGITVAEIETYNNWPEPTGEHVLQPGDEVRIPPGADIPSPDEANSGDASDTTEQDSGSSNNDSGDATDTTEADNPELCPDGERQGHYTIKDTDLTRVGVADRLNVTVQQLDDTNANTPGYSGFFPGLVIKVPCGGDAEATDTTEG